MGLDGNNLYNLLISLFFKKAICGTGDYHEQASNVSQMLKCDSSGLVDSLTNFQVSCATVDMRIDADNETLNDTFEEWLSNINSEFRGKGINVGIRGLQEEYYREIWRGASFPVLKITKWDEINGMNFPVSMVFVDGGSVYAEKKDDKESIDLFAYNYFIGKNKEEQIKGEAYFLYKPFCRSFDKYPTPYLYRRGIYKNWKLIDMIKDKEFELVDRIIPYMMLVLKGSEALTQQNITYSAPELEGVKVKIQELANKMNDLKIDLNGQTNKTPIRVANWDEEIKHLIPDLKSMFQRELFEQAEKNILAGLGFIDIAEATSDSIDRKEFVLIRHKGLINQIRAEELDNLNGKIEVPTFSNGKMVWKSAKIWKHPYQGKMYKLISDDGQIQVRTTANHSIMVWDKDRGLISKKSSEIKIGDLILSLKNLDVSKNKYRHLTYYNSLGSNQNSKIKIPVKIKVDEDFAYFLGWWVAEGSCSKYAIHLAVGTDKEEAEKVAEKGEKIFNKKPYVYPIKYDNPKYKTLYEVRFNSKGIRDLFKNICNTGARYKQIPQVIFNSPKSVQESFLRGLFEGDGHFVKNRNTWDYVTASEKLCYGVFTLSRMIGKIPHIKINERDFISKNFTERRKYYHIYWAKNEGILRDLLPKFKTVRDSYITNFEEIKNSFYNLPTDWVIKRVLKIEEYDYNDMVYDLEVENNPTFVAGTNVLVHNSRRQSVLNPRPFIKECNAGLSDFVNFVLGDLLSLIKEKNPDNIKYKAKKWIVDYDPITEFMSEAFLEVIRGLNDRGYVSNETADFICSKGNIDYQIEKRKRIRELVAGDSITMYPKPIVNTEKDTSLEETEQRKLIKPDEMTDEEKENRGKKPNSPEVEKYKSMLDDELIISMLEAEVISDELVFSNLDEITLIEESKWIKKRTTTNYRRRGIINPSKFQKESFKTIWVSKTDGIRAIIGKLINEESTKIQSYLFEKSKWTDKEVERWMGEHSTKITSKVELIGSPYSNISELPKSVKGLPFPAQKIWMEVFNAEYGKKGDLIAIKMAWGAVKKHYHKNIIGRWSINK